MAEMGGITTIEHQGFSLTTNSGATSEEILARLNPPKEPVKEDEPDLSKAASELGKKGGKAAAEKRAEAKEAKEPTEKAQLQEELAEETEEEKPEEKKEPEKLGKPRHDPKARMLEATRKEAEAKRERDQAKAERDALKARLDALEAAKTAPAEKAEAKPVQAIAKPVRANFQSEEDYLEAIADWKAEEKIKAYKTQTETEQRAKEYASTIDNILGTALAHRREYEKTDPDFQSRLSEDVKSILLKPSFALDLHEKPTVDNVIADEILIAEKKSPLLMLHFSEHPEELERIRDLGSYQDVMVEMRILARSLNGVAPTATTPREVSKALPPVRPVAGVPPSVADEGHTPERASKQSLDEYRKGWKPAPRR